MRRIVAAMNMTMDAVCDHTAGLPDKEIHQHYTELLSQGDAILYGRITFHLMEFWRTVLESPSEERSMNEFAAAIDRIPKIVFSHTLTHTDWKTASISNRKLEDTVVELRQQPGKDIFVGSPGLIIQLMNLKLIDEFQLCIQPVVAGGGMKLFENLKDRTLFKLVKSKTFKSGAVILYYEPGKE